MKEHKQLFKTVNYLDNFNIEAYSLYMYFKVYNDIQTKVWYLLLKLV